MQGHTISVPEPTSILTEAEAHDSLVYVQCAGVGAFTPLAVLRCLSASLVIKPRDFIEEKTANMI